MKYMSPLNSSDPNASYVDENPEKHIPGSKPPAKAFEMILRELENLVVEAGIEPDEDNNFQVLEAVKEFASATSDNKANIGMDNLSENGIDVVCELSAPRQVLVSGATNLMSANLNDVVFDTNLPLILRDELGLKKSITELSKLTIPTPEITPVMTSTTLPTPYVVYGSGGEYQTSYYWKAFSCLSTQVNNSSWMSVINPVLPAGPKIEKIGGFKKGYYLINIGTGFWAGEAYPAKSVDIIAIKNDNSEIKLETINFANLALQNKQFYCDVPADVKQIYFKVLSYYSNYVTLGNCRILYLADSKETAPRFTFIPTNPTIETTLFSWNIYLDKDKSEANLSITPYLLGSVSILNGLLKIDRQPSYVKSFANDTLSNVNASSEFKKTSIGWGLPDWSKKQILATWINITIQTKGMILMRNTEYSSNLNGFVNGNLIFIQLGQWNNFQDWNSMIIPVDAGDVVKLVGGGELTFYPSKGA